MKTLHSCSSSFFWRCFLKGISAFRRSWVSFVESAPIPIRFQWKGLSLSLTAAFARILVLSVYFRKAMWIGLGLFLFLFNCVGVWWARSISTYPHNVSVFRRKTFYSFVWSKPIVKKACSGELRKASTPYRLVLIPVPSLNL